MSLCDVSMVQTVSRRLGSLPDYSLILTDECQHACAKTYKEIYEHYANVIHCGFTATPIRLNKGGLGEVYSDLITSVSTRWLIDNGYLAPYKYYSVKLADASSLHTVAGEFKQDEVKELMEHKEIYGDTVKQWKRLAEGKKTIVYCASVEAAKMTAERFSSEGYSCIALDGNTPKSERETAMARFRSGEITILCNCELFGEGLDVPDCECVVLLRPTQSLTLHIQQSMRSMRYMPGKTATIIDHVGNCYRHGLPDDEREWSLEPKHKQENIVKIRECKECFAVYSPTLAKCPYCGAEATTEIRRTDRKTVEIDLVEVKRVEGIKNTPLCEAELKTWDEIREFQKIKGYKFSWCFRYAKAHGIEIPKEYHAYMWRNRLW
jgi:superfamily II DNA or RNA helicase